MAILESVIEAAKTYQEASLFDSSITIADSEGTIIYKLAAKSFGANTKVGDKAKGTLIEAMETKTVIRRTVPKEKYGVPFKVVSIPLIENDQVAGVLVSSTSVDNQQTLHEAAQSISSMAQQLSATVEESAVSAAELAKELSQARTSTEEILDQIKKTDEILEFIRNVANNSNLLGLNAAIEAARAGDHGHGFAVVAEEIRKMALNSSQAVKNIAVILEKIKDENTNIANAIANSAQRSERQAAVTEEISASMQELNSSATDVERISDVI